MTSQTNPTVLCINFTLCRWNGMIAPFAPYTIKGAIFYQGEANAGKPGKYAEKKGYNIIN